MTGRGKAAFLEDIKNAKEILPDFTVGLNEEEVKERQKEGFTNKVAKKVTKTYWQIFADNVFSFFNILLFAITACMVAAGIHEIKYYFFLIVISCNIVIGLISDIHARVLVDKLRVITDPKARVIRSGKEIEIPINEIVLSDIMLLKAGDQIGADAILVEGSMKTDESLITGESAAVIKNQGDIIFSGSYVKSGTAYARVTKVGIANYSEGLQDSAKKFSRPKSELKRSCVLIFGFTGTIAILMGAAMLITLFVQKGSALTQNDYFNFTRQASGSLIAMIPTGLYLLISLTLATGVISLAKKRMNVQELYCIEMLARVDVICFDKTGTLTDGTLMVERLYNYTDMTESELEEKIGSIVKGAGDDNATAQALLKAYPTAKEECVNSIPFDSEYKYSGVTIKGDGAWIIGAPEFVPSKVSEEASSRIEQLASRGYRVLGVFHSKNPIENSKIPSKLTLVGLISLSDHIKDDAAKNIAWFVENGVDVKVISGDNPITVAEIANHVGVPGAARFISMDKVADEDIPEIAKSYSVFGRVKPEQKALIIHALQDEGHKVAMTGDGVNDIIALKTADCSIAMASGSSAARNVAHIVSLDNDFSKLPDVVGEGRRVINNLQRTASLFLTKTIFAVVISFVFLVSSWISRSSPYSGYPFNTANMGVWEIVTIGGGGFFLALQPSKEKICGGFLKNVIGNALPAGIAECLSVIIIFSIYWACPSFFGNDPESSFLAAKTVSVLLFTFLSYQILLRVSLPLDKYRLFVFLAMLFFGVLFFVIDIVTPGKGMVGGRETGSRLFDLYYSYISGKQILLLLGVLVGLVIIYFVFDYLMRKYVTKQNFSFFKENKTCESTKK